MALDNRCFKKARDFSGSVFGEHITALEGVGYVFLWMQKIGLDKRYMINNVYALGNPAQYALVFKKDWGFYATLERFWGSRPTLIQNDLFKAHFTHCVKRLDHYKSKRANFALIHLRNVNDWQRVVVLKLDQSYTGGFLNRSYPCAMFDPKIGQGMYSNHTDLAHDLCALLNEYNLVTGSFNAVDTYLLRLDRMN
jgi:hypothetical protein